MEFPMMRGGAGSNHESCITHIYIYISSVMI